MAARSLARIIPAPSMWRRNTSNRAETRQAWRGGVLRFVLPLARHQPVVILYVPLSHPTNGLRFFLIARKLPVLYLLTNDYHAFLIGCGGIEAANYPRKDLGVGRL